ncbi:vanadium-dependent haloperoxidase [Segetibacter sp. 3557_3]|uniref:vanadium-dependent haloperoxidase n=1 Tax=Segetibacter sp. 3557_3 TaxID=2547429 RepID=UPI001FB5B4EB|nr:vanadium-dependent haloperoxidase [Segetibacter sp. 3557_3]
MGNNFSPIVASRNYLYANIAAYEVIAAGYPQQYNSLATMIRELPDMPKAPKDEINYEFAALLAFCKLGETVTFPEGSMQQYTDTLKITAREHGMPKAVVNGSVEFADSIAAVILRWSKKDNYAQTRSAERYTVTDEEGRWIPTPPAYTSAMEPHWNKIRTLVMDSARQFFPPPPIKFNIKDTNSAYYKQVITSKRTIENLTEEQKHIAEFWDDNPFKLNVSGHLMYGTKKFSPPGHWMSIVGIASKTARADFATTVYAYAKTSIALFEAFIQCWDAKYCYNTARPETIINKYIDPSWQPFLQTPPFPEYTCGHSTCSSAAAEALTSVYGDNFAYTDTSELEFGIKSRSFSSFRQAADENNWARFYGGIHFHPTCVVSSDYGKRVGALVVEKLRMKK